MSLYVRVFTNFYSHRKTLRLRAVLGDDAFWIPPRLWAYAAENQPDGNFSDYSPEEIASVLGYMKDASSMLQALLKAGFMDSDMRIHDWEEYNAYHKVFAERARKGGIAKREKERTKEKGTERKGKEPSTASSTASSITVNGSRSSPHVFPKDFLILIKNAEAECNRLKAKGANESPLGIEWHNQECRTQYIETRKSIKGWQKQLLAMKL